ncbi:MAG: alpha/beta fold hydrolase [Rubrobacteraceae bacterium]
MARVMEGAEPFRIEGNDVGVLISHGFTGTPQSVRPLGEALARAGFTVAGPRLAGHGTSVRDMAKSSVEDWISSLEEDFAWLRERSDGIYLTGLSMGGTFALYMAAMHPEFVRGVLPINGCISLDNPDLARLAFDPKAPATVPGVGSDIKARGVEELAYGDVPVPSVREFMALMRVTEDLLPTVTVPAVVFQSLEDHVVPPENGPYIHERLGSTYKQLIRLENSYHVATLDNDADLIAERIIRFVLER